MDIKKQHIVLNLIKSGRYTLDHETGNVISHIGREPRILQPIKQYTGYLQYNLDIGFNHTISVYGQGFSYLAKWLVTYDPTRVIDHKDKVRNNNKPGNLQCITIRQNNIDNFANNPIRKGFIRKRLAPDEKEAILQGYKDGISFVKLAAKYETTRQTIAHICKKLNSVDEC